LAGNSQKGEKGLSFLGKIKGNLKGDGVRGTGHSLFLSTPKTMWFPSNAGNEMKVRLKHCEEGYKKEGLKMEVS